MGSSRSNQRNPMMSVDEPINQITDERWSEAMDVSSQAYVERVKRLLEITARHREADEANETYALRELLGAYTDGFDTENSALTPNNTILLAEKTVSPNA